MEEWYVSLMYSEDKQVLDCADLWNNNKKTWRFSFAMLQHHSQMNKSIGPKV